MQLMSHGRTVFAGWWTLCTLALRGATATDTFRGVSPALQTQLAAATSFTCDEGANKFDLTRLNDDYCDCADGVDEPGTSACSHTNAVFHCVNVGFFAQDIPTSRVNDHICDCCDGSDEYNGIVNCPVTCQTLMEQFKADKAEDLRVMEEGELARKALEDTAEKLWAEKLESRTTLEVSIANLQVQVEQLEAVKAHEEQLEQQEQRELISANKREMMTQLGLLDLSQEQLGTIILHLGDVLGNKDDLIRFIRQERDAVEPKLGKTPIEEAEEAFRDRDAKRQEETNRIEKLIKERQERKEELERKKAEAVATAEGGDDEQVDKANAVDATEVAEDEEEELVLPEVEERPVKLLFDRIAGETHQRHEAQEARDKHRDAKKELATAESDLRKLSSELDKDYGVDRVLLALKDECVEAKSGSYVYKICFFGKATQDHVRLGNMDDLSADAPNQLLFSKGDKCWNGPNRSLTVDLVCGAMPLELYEIEEPSTCVYTAKLRTPTACDQHHRELVLSLSQSGVPAFKPHQVEIEVAPTL